MAIFRYEWDYLSHMQGIAGKFEGSGELGSVNPPLPSTGGLTTLIIGADKNGVLQDQLMRKYASGLLPRTIALRAWAGKAGSNAICALCDSSIDAVENEFEIEWRQASNIRILRLHVRCFWFWCTEVDT
jgi:hypothetical protein